MKECKNCGALIDDFDITCKYCTYSFATGSTQSAMEPEAPPPQPASVVEPAPAAPVAPEPPSPPWTEQPPQPQVAQPQQQPYAQPYQPPYYQQGQPTVTQAQPYPQQQVQVQPQVQGQQPYPQQGQPYHQGQQPYVAGPQQYNQNINIHVAQAQAQGYGPAPGYRNISKITAGVLAILLGGIGVHKFYMGKIGIGILYVLFFWTAIPALIGFIEGIYYLCMDDLRFREKYARIY